MEIKKVDAGQETEVQISPFGRFWQTVDDKDVEQICDEFAFEKIVENFAGEILVDREHLSEYERGDTEASAWITKVWIDKIKGLMGTFRWSSRGAELVNGYNYRFLSPCWILDDSGRPNKLLSVGLTNKNNIPVMPVLNSKKLETETITFGEVKNMNETEKEKEVEEVAEEVAEAVKEAVKEAVAETPVEEVAEAVAEEVKETPVEEVAEDPEPSELIPEDPEPIPNESEESNEKTMADVSAILGLAESATIDDVLATIKTLLDATAEMQEKEEIAEAEKAIDDSGVADVVENRESLVQMFRENRESFGICVRNMQVLKQKLEKTEQISGITKAGKRPGIALNRGSTNPLEIYQSLKGEEASKYLRTHWDSLK